MPQSVAFTAVLAHGVTLGLHQAVEFDKVMTNVGNAYFSRDGQFAAPVYGLYMISAVVSANSSNSISTIAFDTRVKVSLLFYPQHML